jgi:peptidoglycan/xylan/chitin deacetylase (PgdA/CDA1 family)
MLRIFFTWDDGHPDDFRLKDLHEQYAFPCILFVPAKNREGISVMNSSDLRRINSTIVDIGSHTYNHIYLTELTREGAKEEILNGKTYLEDILGKSVPHFCLPGGKYNKTIIKDALKINKTVRTANTMCIKQQYPVVNPMFHFYSRSFRSIALNSIKHCSISVFCQLAEYTRRFNYFDFIHKYIQFANSYNLNEDIILYGHSWELTKYELWGELNTLFKFIRRMNINVVRYNEIC